MAKGKPAERVKIRLRKDDLVEVIAGKDAGKRGQDPPGPPREGPRPRAGCVVHQAPHQARTHRRTSRAASPSARRRSTCRT